MPNANFATATTTKSQQPGWVTNKQRMWSMGSTRLVIKLSVGWLENTLKAGTTTTTATTMTSS